VRHDWKSHPVRPLHVADDPHITRDLAAQVLAQFLGQPSVALRLELGGPIIRGYGVSTWDEAHDCYLIRLKAPSCTWHDLAHEVAHCVNDIEPGRTYDLDADPDEMIREIMGVDPVRGEDLKMDLVQRELRADYWAAYILTELRELAASRGWDLCD
jgi:hypothetical protein